MTVFAKTIKPIPVASGDWSEDNRSGREYANYLLSEMRDNETPFMFGWLIDAVAEEGRYDGVIVGLSQRVSECATAGFEN